MSKIKIILFFILFTSILIFAEDNKEDLKSLKEERLETIKFGIETQVTDLLKILESENNFEFNEELLKLLRSSTNSRLDQKIINLFTAAEDESAKEYAFNELQENYNLRNDIRVVYINYIAKYQNKETSEYLLTLIEEENDAVSIAAIKALGSSDLNNIIPILLKYLDDSLFDTLRKPAIIESLGKLKAIEALEILSDLATDNYSDDKSLRWRAVVALGEIGAKESLPVLQSLFSDDDPNLRNYTITALKHFPPKEISALLIQGLKDSFWKVRVNAAQSLGELKIKDAIPILIYKTENDPDIRNVRSASLIALGEIGGKDSFDLIRKLYENDRSDIGLRSIAIKILTENDLSNSLKIIKTVLDKEWEKDKPVMLDYTCKMLSITESSSLKNLYVQMLSYEKTLNLKLYALRGIKLNSITSLKSEVEKFTSEDSHSAIQKLALDVLKEL
jgi:HEAT repeat protein